MSNCCFAAPAAIMQDVTTQAIDSQLASLSSHISLQLQQQAWSSNSSDSSTNQDLLLQVVPLLWGVRKVLLQQTSMQQELLAMLLPTEDVEVASTD
jgi:hypothetical protein